MDAKGPSWTREDVKGPGSLSSSPSAPFNHCMLTIIRVVYRMASSWEGMIQPCAQIVRVNLSYFTIQDGRRTCDNQC